MKGNLSGKQTGWLIIPFFHFKDTPFSYKDRGNTLSIPVNGTFKKKDILSAFRYDFTKYYFSKELNAITVAISRVYTFDADLISPTEILQFNDLLQPRKIELCEYVKNIVLNKQKYINFIKGGSYGKTNE